MRQLNGASLWIAVALAGGCGGKAPEGGASGATGTPPAASATPAASSGAPADRSKSGGGRTEQEKAQAEPYANDLGPATVSAHLLATYPAPIRAGYDFTITRCARCHTAARPLNSQFVEADVWKRYVKRMMAKPGCEISAAEGKRIWEFLVHDSKVRKTGAKAAAWAAHRQALLDEFKAKHPDRYALLYGGG